MLQAIREKTSGWIAYVIIGLISIPFALWGVNSYLGGGEERPAAIVDGEEITSQHLDYAYSRYRENLASMFGGRVPEELADDTLKEQALGQLIEETVLLGYIDERGYRVSDEQLFSVIRENPGFMVDGRFDPQRYKDQLASQGYVPAQFEEQLRSSSEMQQLRQALRTTGFVTPVQAEQFQNMNLQERKLRTITIQSDLSDTRVSDAEIENYYEEHATSYMRPARVKVDYIQIDLQTVAAGLEVSEGQLEQRYEQVRDTLTSPEYRSASHILLTVDSDADEAARAEVRKRIEALKTRIDQGEDFAALAREYSQDPGSAADGGDLGEVELGMMVKPFETVLFSMSPGDVSDPVQTRFGWHLIKLHEVSGGETPGFADARAQIERELRTEMAESQIYDLAESLANITYEQFDSLLPAAEQLGLNIRSSDWFTRASGEGIAEDPRVRDAAFSSDVLQENRNSEAIELGANRMVVLHLANHQPAQQQPLAEVRDDIIIELKRRKAREQSSAIGKELLADLNSGQSMEDVAASEGLQIQDHDFVKRGAAGLDADILNLAFSMPKPSIGGLEYEGLSEASGDYTIVEMSDVRVATDSADQDIGAMVQRLSAANSDAEYRALVEFMVSNADVTRTPVSELR